MPIKTGGDNAAYRSIFGSRPGEGKAAINWWVWAVLDSYSTSAGRPASRTLRPRHFPLTPFTVLFRDAICSGWSRWKFREQPIP